MVLADRKVPLAIGTAFEGYVPKTRVLRSEMESGLRAAGIEPVDGRAPFVLFSVGDAELMRKHLDGKGIAVRRCDTFVGLDGEYLRAAVRPHWPVLVDAIAESLR